MNAKNIVWAALAARLLFSPVQVSAEQQAGCSVELEKLSAEERAWFTTFQEGTFFARGWKDITAEVLKKAPQKAQDDLRQAMNVLGTRIGREWSKRNDVRKISTDMLQQWGDLLQQTANQEPALLPQVVASINQKVVTLLD